MKNYDPKVAARVWERVQEPSATSADSQALLHLIAEEWLDAITYQHLARKLPTTLSPVARQLSQQEQSHAACLKGIYTMLTGAAPKLPTPTHSDDPADIILRRCYGREMRCLAQYESRRGDPVYGHIFRRLAQQEQEHCHRILELLGALAK